MNRLLIPYTLRNLAVAVEVGFQIDEQGMRDTLSKVRHLAKENDPYEAVIYNTAEFYNNWRGRLADYPNSSEFQTNFAQLKEEVDQTLPEVKPTQKKVFLFLGVPGSGKTTLAKLIKEELNPSVTLRSDWIFFEKLRDQIEDDYSKAYVYQEELAQAYLGDGYSVVLDENLRTAQNRQEIYRWVRVSGTEPILIVIDVDLEKAADRLTLKAGDIKTKEEKLAGLRAFQAQMEEPTAEEGKAVKVIRVDGNQPLEEIKEILKREITSK